MDKDLIIKRIVLERDKIESFDKYPFNIEIIKNLKEIEFKSKVTFLVGENGIGKSTIIEAIAVALGLPAEGGTQNFQYKTKNTTSNLSEYLTIETYNKPEMKFFLRAESFYNFSTEVQRLVEEDGYGQLYKYYGGNLHECSHGESFLNLVKNRFTPNGLYILDEPEAALSPQNQLKLMVLIDRFAKKGSQFIIATHSPFILGYRDARIINLDEGMREITFKQTSIYNLYRHFLDNPNEYQKMLFDEEDC